MNQYKIEEKYSGKVFEYTYVEIESLDEYLNLLNVAKSELDNFLKYLIKTDEKAYRWDHIKADGMNKSLFTASVNMAKFNGSSILMEMDNLINIRNKGILETLEKHGSVLINPDMGTYREPFGKNEFFEIVAKKKLLELEALLPTYDKYMTKIEV